MKEKKDMKMKTFKRPKIETAGERAAFEYGIRLAASVAADYDKLSMHSHLVSECILGKLNLLKGKPAVNAYWAVVDAALTRIEHKIESLEGTMRFATRHTNSKRSTLKRL